MKLIDKLRIATAARLLPSSFKGFNKSEKATPDAAPSAVPAFFMPQHRTPPKYGTGDLLHGYSEMPWLRAVVGKIGQAVGTTCWRIYIAKGKDGKAVKSPIALYPAQKRWDAINRSVISENNNLELIEDHPIIDLLRFGNDYMIGQTVIQLTQNHLDLVGESYWMLEKNQFGVPKGIWPIPPNWVVEMPSSEHPYYTINFERRRIEVPMSMVIRFFDPDPANPYGRGVGVARALGDELEIDELSAKHLKSFFFNNARPDIIISGDGLKQTDTARMEEKWLDKHQGFWNRFKPHFINRKIDVTEVGQSFEEMQISQLRRAERDSVMQVFGISPEKLGVLSASNRSTIAAADIFWQKDTIMPRMELLRNTLQRYLIPMFDERIIIDFESPVVEDKEFILDVMRANPKAFTRDDWRKFAHFPTDAARGDVYIMGSSDVEIPADEEVAYGEGGNSESDPPKDPPENEEDPKEEDDEKEEEKALSSLDSDDFIHDVTNKVMEKLLDKVRK